MQNALLMNRPADLARAIDQQKLVRSVLQRIANSTGKKIHAPGLANDSVVEPDNGSFGWLTELEIKK